MNFLVIPDTHCPHQHVDAWKFLDAVIQKYGPFGQCIHLGDEIDGHAWSFHSHDPDLLSPSQELEKAKIELKNLAILCPKLALLESNHGSLFYRKLKHHGLPISILKTANEILEVPKTWKWFFDLVIKLPNGQEVYFHHGKTGRAGALSRSMAMNAVQGHYHSLFHLTYWSNKLRTYWDCHAGCLVDAELLAFEYAKNNLPFVQLGCLIIVNSNPQLVQMRLDKNKRWIGRL